MGQTAVSDNQKVLKAFDDVRILESWINLQVSIHFCFYANFSNYHFYVYEHPKEKIHQSLVLVVVIKPYKGKGVCNDFIHLSSVSCLKMF